MRIGFAVTGSFCTHEKALIQMKRLVDGGHEVTPILSEAVYATDTRFGTAADFIKKAEEITGHKALHTITDTEPIGPKKLFDLLLVLPCTSNTLAKLALGINDTAVTMAVKSHLRGEKPVVIGVSTNDALGAAAKNIGLLMNYKHYYFIPLTMDDPENKPKSMVCDFTKTKETVEAAAKGKDMIRKIL